MSLDQIMQRHPFKSVTKGRGPMLTTLRMDDQKCGALSSFGEPNGEKQMRTRPDQTLAAKCLAAATTAQRYPPCQAASLVPPRFSTSEPACLRAAAGDLIAGRRWMCLLYATLNTLAVITLIVALATPGWWTCSTSSPAVSTDGACVRRTDLERDPSELRKWLIVCVATKGDLMKAHNNWEMSIRAIAVCT